MADLFGGFRSGLGISVVLVGALLAASTGIVGATVVTMGLDVVANYVKARLLAIPGDRRYCRYGYPGPDYSTVHCFGVTRRYPV